MALILDSTISVRCLFELNLSKDWFSEFKAEETEIKLGINCELIFKIFNCLGENQNIELTYDLSEGDYIYITLYPQEGERGIRKEFQVPLMNLDSDFLPVPDSDWSADIQMVSDDFSKLIDEKIVPRPKSYYGYTKLLGENYVKKYGENYLIMRFQSKITI